MRKINFSIYLTYLFVTLLFNQSIYPKLQRPRCGYIQISKIEQIIEDQANDYPIIENIKTELANLTDLTQTNTLLVTNTASPFINDLTITKTDSMITTTTTSAITPTTQKIIKNKIRVLLDEKNSKELNNFFIQSSEGVTIQGLPKTTSPILLKNKTVHIKIKDNNLYLSPDGKKYKKSKKKEILIRPIHKHFSFNNKTFKGEVKLKIDTKKNRLFIINHLNLENYIYSVLRYESYPTWPKNMQKVQAIASRSYAFYCMKLARTKKNKDPYDIKRSNHHQTYNGTHNSKHLKDAVRETQGVILTYNQQPIIAMFDACCGGIIPANMKNPDFKKAPYLARQERCIFCKNYVLYKWKKDLFFNSFIKSLKQNKKLTAKINALGKVHDIKITDKDKAGIVHKIKFIGSKRNLTISARDFCENQRKTLRSLNFNLKKINDRLVINGNGFGHQIGLCQRGARELLNRGWNYKNILKFYYPKTQFANLKYS